MRIAAVFMSQPSLGISESPMPGRSGAMTVNLSLSLSIRGRHIREVWGVIAFDLATKLTDDDGDTAMDEEESLVQHGFADYTPAPREGFLTARRLLRSTKK